eukprot:12755017-Ditylum_brightwellii.AAC.1
MSGMKESEMPSSIYTEGIYVEGVTGLSSAAALDASVENVGYIAFVRGDKSRHPAMMTKLMQVMKSTKTLMRRNFLIWYQEYSTT